MGLAQAAEPQAAPPSDSPAAAAPTQAPPVAPPAQSAPEQVPSADPNAITIPAGSRIPLSLAQAISTKNAREGDSVYATTAFPFVLNDQVLIPAGAYIQGTITHVERAKRLKGRAEISIHFTSMIYPNGYTVMLPGMVQNTPGADNKGVKDSEGTIQQDSDKGRRVEDAAKGGVVGTLGGATAGSLATGGLNGARVGAGIGAATGVAWALLKKGSELKMEVGTSIEMEVQRAISVDAERVGIRKTMPAGPATKTSAQAGVS